MAGLRRAPDAVARVQEEVAAAGEVLELLRAGRRPARWAGRRWRGSRSVAGSMMRACGGATIDGHTLTMPPAPVEGQRPAERGRHRARGAPRARGRAARRTGRRRSSTCRRGCSRTGCAPGTGSGAGGRGDGPRPRRAAEALRQRGRRARGDRVGGGRRGEDEGQDGAEGEGGRGGARLRGAGEGERAWVPFLPVPEARPPGGRRDGPQPVRGRNV